MLMCVQALLLLACVLAVQSFQIPITRGAMLKSASSISTSISPSSSRVNHRSSNLQMNVFGDAIRFFSNMNKEASAKHILITGNDAVSKLNLIKAELTGAADLSTAFSELASKVSECPSAKRGGNLGTFKPGMMVREFDEVCFEKEVGVVHGPVETQFGAHLIYITRRYEGEEKK